MHTFFFIFLSFYNIHIQTYSTNIHTITLAEILWKFLIAVANFKQCPP